MKHLRIALAAAITAGTSIVLFGTAAASSDNPNDASYWEAQTEHPATCYKHDPPNQQTAHGKLTADGKAVVLNPFNPNWPGDHWELLVVKAGSSGGDGNGNAIYDHPAAGVAYAAPEGKEVSHWIVCKGTSPDPVETSVTWTATNGTCESPDGTLAVEFDGAEVTYTGDPAGTYPNGEMVGGSFAAKTGFVITGDDGPFSHTFSLTDAPCDVEVTPAVPMFVDPTCASPQAAVTGAVDTESVDYTVSGSVVPGGMVTVTASAKAGFVLVGPTEWEHTFSELDEDDCVIPANPESGIEVECGAATLIFSNDVGEIAEGFTAESAQFSYTVDGVTTEIEVEPNGSIEVPVSFDEDSGVHTVQVGDGEVVEVETNCELDEVTPAVPMFVDPTCASPQAAVTGAVDTESVDYTVSGSVVPGGMVTVTASAKAGFVLVGPTEWEHTFSELDEDDCVIPANPESGIEVECGAATLIFSNDVGEIAEGFTAESAQFSYTVDGVTTEIEVEPNGSIEVPVSFDEDSGVHTVQVGDGEVVEVETNCELDEVTPAVPMFVDPTCASPQAAVTGAVDTESVDYTVSGSVVPGGMVTVTASAKAGFVLVGQTEWKHEFPSIDDLDCDVPPEPEIGVTAFSQVCQADVPYVLYDIEVIGTDVDRAKLTFRAFDGDIAAVYENVPLSGQVIYPGASVDPQDWPGWKLNSAGLWVPDDEDADWRNGLTVEIEVNPTATASVTYPPASDACLDPELEPPTTPPTTPTTVDTVPVTTTAIGQAGPTVPAPQLPRTGSDSASSMVAIGMLLLVGGFVLVGATRRRSVTVD